jgi:hypothetical protein
MHLYKYTSIANLRHLLNGTIRFTQPKAFNDPFELVPEFFCDNGEIIHIKGLDIDTSPTIPHPALLEDDFESTFCNDSAARDLLNTINEHVGILCLSQEYNSLLMWAHYGDEYKGAIVGFDAEHSFFSNKFPIQYRDNRPKLNFKELLNDKDEISLSDLCYKSSTWGYEHEYRLFSSLKDCVPAGNVNNFVVYTKKIPIECIKSITLGERTPIQEQREIFAMIMHTDIELYLSEVSNWGYQFRPDRIKLAASIDKIQPMVSPRTAKIFCELDSQLGEMARWMIEYHPLSTLVNKTL